MVICILGDAGSIHTRKWVEYFAGRYQVHIITFTPGTVPGCTVHLVGDGKVNVGGGNISLLKNIFQVRRLIKAINPDLVHAHYATSYGLMAALCGRKPLFVTGHGTDVVLTPFRNFIYKKAFKYTYRKSTLFFIVAAHMKIALERLGLDTRKAYLINNGVNLDLFNYDPSKRTKEISMVCTRNFEPVYNHRYFLEIFADVYARYGLKLNLAGSGTLLEESRQFVQGHNLENAVTFVGKLTQEQIADLLKQNHIYVSTSLSDGSSVSLMEAMAAGLIPVLSDIPANREWITHRVNGYLIPLDNKENAIAVIREMLAEWDKVSGSIIEKNLALVKEKADWNKNIRELEKIYLSNLPGK